MSQDKTTDDAEFTAIMAGREYCPRCGSGPRQAADVEECPDCGYPWAGPPLITQLAPERS